MKKGTKQKNKINWLPLQDLINRLFKRAHAPTQKRPTIIKKRERTQNVTPQKYIEKISPTVKLTPQAEKTKLLSNKKFLSFPVEKDDKGNMLTPYIAEVGAILDHSGTPIDPTANTHAKWHQDTNEVRAFNGEVGNFKKFKEEKHAGFSQKSGASFLTNAKINYVGVRSQGGNKYLQYDGHSGYDYRFIVGTPLVAPADGYLSKAADDFVNGKGRQTTAWGQWHTFYIKHQNGFLTYFLHCKELQADIEKQIGVDCKKTVQVTKGQPIALTGDFGYGKHGVKWTPFLRH